MALETDFNQSPYFDDYVDVAEGKDYHRILFKPGLAVQARELTQIQSIMQEQVARFGDNVFVEGTIIDGCGFQYDANVAFVKLRDRDPGGNTIAVSVFANGIVQGLTSGVRAKVIKVVSGSEASAPDTNVFLVKYLNGGTSGTAKTFSLNETLSYLPADGGSGQQANTLSASAFGFGSIFSVGEGIVYGKGHFVNVQPQSIILEKFSTKPSYKVGFQISESIVDSDADQTLLDNARGAYNYTAPGADRLKLTASLTKKVLGTANTEAFTPIFEVDSGNIRTVKPTSIYDEIGRLMAERTFDESGNYEIKHMNTTVKEHLDNGTNFGRFTAANGGDANKLAIGIEPGEAYIMGYHNEHLSTVFVATDKGTTTKEELGVTVTTNYGNYIDATEVAGPWDPTTYQTVSLRSAAAGAISNTTFGSTGAPGSEVGTARLRFVEYQSGNPGEPGGRYRFYLFDVKMTSGTFEAVRGLYVNNVSGPDSHADLVLTAGAAVLSEPSFNTMVYDSGIDAVKQFTNSSNTVNATYTYRDKATVSFSTGGTATLTMSGAHAGGTEELAYGVGTLNATQKNSIQVVVAATATSTTSGNTYAQGYIWNLANTTVTVSSATQMSINLNQLFSGTFNATVFFNAQREAASPARKLVRKNRYVKLNLNTHSAGASGPWGLGFADVFNLRNVYVGSSYSVTNRNVTSDFRIIKNSNDSMYKHSELALKESSSLTLNSSDKLLVEFDFFDHDRSTGIGFFNVDSYVIDPNESTSNTNAIATPQIPVYSSTAANKAYDLRDSVDFRPRISSTANNTTTISLATTNPLASTTLDIDSDGTYVPIPNLNWESDVLYYLGRVDRVAVSKDGRKNIIKGVPGERPVPPAAPAESMTIATLTIPPYPSLSLENAYRFDRVDQAVRVRPEFHRRYTMSDIQTLSDRIDNLEYYTALNVLEKSARDLQIADNNGLNRFKNGIFVDSFFGHNFADITNVAYNASVDKVKGELRPRFEQLNIDMQLSSLTNAVRKGKHVRLDVTGATGEYAVNDVVYVGASFGSATATGTVRAVVSTGASSYRLYLHNTTGAFNATETLKNNTQAGTSTISTVQDAVTSDLITVPYTHTSYITQPWASNTINPVGELSFNWRGELTLNPEADHWVDTTTQPDITFEFDFASNWQALAQAWGTQWGEWNTTTQTTTESNQFWESFGLVDETTITQVDTAIREGIRLGINPFERTQSGGSFITSVDIIPFIRSREVDFTATGMRPNTTVYPYFDDVDVSAYVTPATLTTDSEGSVTGKFTIPNDDALKFRCGERVFKLVDISDLITQAGTQTTSSTARYVASGLTTSERGISITTREATITAETVSETDVTTTTSTTTTVTSVDPIAQTFTVGDGEFSNPLATHDATSSDVKFGTNADGVFATGIDLYFQAKPSSGGISVEIREVQNGSITSIRVPLAYKRIAHSDVNISADASDPTPFYFDSPVYLRGNKEYAMIIKPDGSDPNYRVWISTLGGTDVASGALIDQQPAVGMLFTSANDRTYAPRQNQDIKFTLWRASFTTGTSGTVVMTNQPDEYMNVRQILGRYTIGETLLGESIVQLVNASNTASIAVGDTVAFGSNTGIVRKIVTTTPPTFKADIKGTLPTGQTITFTRPSVSYTATANTFTANSIAGEVQFFNPVTGELVANNSTGGYSANSTLFDGFIKGLSSNATSQVVNVRDYKYNVVSPRLSVAQYVDTSYTLEAKTTSNAYSIGSYASIRTDRDTEFYDEEKIVAGKTSEVNNTSGSKTLSLRATISTSNDRVTPIVDLGRAKSIVLIHNKVNNVNTSEFGNYGKAVARYITKKITLADGQDAEDIKIILDAYKPTGTEVDVYARIQNAFDGEEFYEKAYTKLDQTNNAARNSSIVDKEDFVELEYSFPSVNATAISANTGASGVVGYRNSDGADFQGYKTYSIKIVMRSTGSQLVPRVKGLRAIALQV